ncbi:MAG: DUF2283 domain-containing protein [Phycisphaerales bacterium]|jgi:uncharacterized protein YuzE
MKVRYFKDTDTLYVEFRAEGIVETKDLDDQTLLDVDGSGRLCAITIEHASTRVDLSEMLIEGVAA